MLAPQFVAKFAKFHGGVVNLQTDLEDTHGMCRWLSATIRIQQTVGSPSIFDSFWMIIDFTFHVYIYKHIYIYM